MIFLFVLRLSCRPGLVFTTPVENGPPLKILAAVNVLWGPN
jgi:hypothetical protein